MRFVTNKAGEIGDYAQLAMKGPVTRLPRRESKLLLKHLCRPYWRDGEMPPEIRALRALMARLVDVPNIPYFEVNLKRHERHERHVHALRLQKDLEGR